VCLTNCTQVCKTLYSSFITTKVGNEALTVWRK